MLDTISPNFAAALAVESVAWSRTALLIALALMVLAATLCVVVVLSLARSRRRASRPQSAESFGEDVLAILLERTREAAEGGEERQTIGESLPEERLELCEIGWSRGRLRSYFSAAVLAANGSARVVGASPKIWLRRTPPRARGRTLKAYGVLVRQLGDAGWRAAGTTELWFRWEPLGRSSLWYEERFRRPAIGWTGLLRGDAGGVRNSARTQDR